MINLLCLLCFVAFLQEGLSQQCSQCPDGFTYYPTIDKCLMAVSSKLSWIEARQYCNQRYSHLVVIESDAEINPLKQAIEPVKNLCVNSAVRGPAFWTSGRRRCPYSEFVWKTHPGSYWDLIYTNWLPGEPNNLRGVENCIHFLARDDATLLEWNDTQCELVNCFVCEINP